MSRGSMAAADTHDTVVSNGEKRLDRVDMRIQGRGQVHFEFRRRYRSQLAYDGPLGYGWDFTYNETLFPQGDGDVVRSDGRGGQATWTRGGGGDFSSPPGHFGTLRQEIDGSYTLRDPDGFRRTYTSDGRLSGYQDRFGNTMTFTYDARGNLRRATDAFGRTIDFVFETFPDGRDRLVTLRDFTGREVQFSYTPNGDLAEVRSPIVSGTSTLNDFPAGRIERYGYREGTGTAADHNLTTVTRPREVALGGPPAITVNYGETTGTLEFDRVTSETLGGNNASGVAAGGTVNYGYTAVNQAAGPNVALSRLDVLVTEANGNQVLLQVNENDHLLGVRQLTRGLREGDPDHYQTTSFYTGDGQLVRRVFPAGNELRHSYASAPRAAQGNCTETRWIADSTRGGGELSVRRTYEPLYQQLASQSDPREHDAGFVPPIGTKAPGRYVRRWFYDYQEHSAPVAEAAEWGLSLASVSRGLGDLNADEVTTQNAGHPVREGGPTVILAGGSNMAAVLGDTTQEIVWERQWNDRGQLTAEIDPEGNRTDYTYYPEDDPDGDGASVPGQSSGLTRGYLRTRTADSSVTYRRTSSRAPAGMETHYAYDPLGRLIDHRNPRGVSTTYELNALDEVVATTRGASTAEAILRGQLPTNEAPFAYTTQYLYDHNGRLTQRRVEDDPSVSTTTGVAGWVDVTYVYDINDNLLETGHEVGAGRVAVTQYRYDANGLRTEVRHPRANQTALPAVWDNVDTIRYDERNLPYRITHGAGGSDAGTYQLDYDANGNRSRLIDAEDNDFDLSGEVTTYTYDGHDRRTVTTTPERTERRWSYDPAGNRVGEQVWGHPGDDPTGAVARLSETRYVHDELNRVVQVDRDLFVRPGVTPVRPVVLSDGNSDGVVTVAIEHDALGHERFYVEDDGGLVERRYDGAGRLAELHHGLGNRTDYVYDQNGNVVREIETEHSPENLVADQVSTTYHVYDQLDRRVRTTNDLGETERWGFDSRDNLTAYSDANGELQAGVDPLGVYPGVINDPGNDRRYEYDGADRRTAEVTNLYVGGLPGPNPMLDTSNGFNPDGQIRVGFSFDLNGNLTGITDDNGRTTSFAFDGRDRRISRSMSDNATYTFTYDRDNNLTQTTDPNGTQVFYSYDLANRRTRTDVVRGFGVLGTTVETYSYDGLGNLARSSDDNGGVATTEMLRAYDSLDRLLEETQGTRARSVSYQYDGDGNLLSQTLGEGKTFTYSYDELDRLKTIDDPNPVLTDVCYIGRGNRELQRDLGNTTRVMYHDGAGQAWHDAVGRVTRMLSNDPQGVPWLERDYTYDRNGRRLSERRVDDGGQVDEYVYDSADRVVTSRLDRFGAISRRDQRVDEFTYDGVGNRRRTVRSTASSPPVTTDYAVNNVNAYTSIGATAITYDQNGNQFNDTFRAYQYDYKDRLVRVALTTGEELAVYSYDTDDRRVTRLFKNSAQQVLSSTESYYDDKGRVADQWSFRNNDTFLNQAYGPAGVDDVIFFEVTLGVYPFDRRTWFVRNPRHDLVGQLDFGGIPLEKYIYDEFGSAYVVYGGLPNPPYLFQGRVFDSETGHYHWRARYYVPDTGRFLSRDPGIYDPINAANQYTYVGNAPTTRVDPYGRSPDLQPKPRPPAPQVSELYPMR